MYREQNATSKTILTGMEFFTLFLIFSGIAVQLVLGRNNMLFFLLRLVFAPCMVFLAGMYAASFNRDIRFLLSKAACYACIFAAFGVFNQVVLNHRNPFQSFIRVVTMVLIPTPSEMFFTAAILFLCAALAAKHLETIRNNIRLFALLGIVSVLMAFFPSDIFGYPVIGVFTGCDTYADVALIPYFGFFLAGIFAEPSKDCRLSRKKFAAAGILSFSCAVLFFTPLKPAALIGVSALPVLVIYTFCCRCRLYRNLTEWAVKVLTSCLSMVRQLVRDFADSKKKAMPLYFAAYTMLFLTTAAGVFLLFMEYDNSIAWTHDAISQYIPRIHYFIGHVRECLSGLLKGDISFPSYSFRNGLGNAVTLSYEPVYWLFALFNPSDVESAYNIITLFRFFLAGLSASVFFLYHKRGYFESLIGSMMYTFCGFAIYAGVLHAHFIAPMIFLPLLMIATEEVFRKGRWYLCTIVVAVALPANYYFIYMSTIAMGIYYVGRFLFTKDSGKKTWKYFFTATLTFAGSYLLGVVIGNISLFTSFASFMSSGRPGNSELSTLSLFYYRDSWLVRLYTYFITSAATPGAWLKLGFIPLSYLAVVALLMKKGNKLLKFLFLTCITFCIFPFAAFVLGGFSNITNRWCYILALLVSYITVRMFPELRALTRRELKIMFLSVVPYVLIILMNRDYRMDYTLASLSLLLCNFAVVLCMNKNVSIISQRSAKAMLMALCCGALIINAYYQYLGGKNTSEGSFVKQGHVLSEITDTPMKALSGFPDDSFYRVSTAEIPRKNLCSSLIMDYNSIATFSSTISSPVINYNVSMGNTAWNLVQLGGFDNRTFMNSLACVKYYSLKDKEIPRLPYGYKEIGTKKEGKADYHIYENSYALPLGYTYDSVLSEEDLEKHTALERQEIMLQAAAVADPGETSLKDAAALSSTSREAKITDYQAQGLKVEGNKAEILKPGATLTLSFEGLEDSETYLVFDGFLNSAKNNDEHLVKLALSCGDYSRKVDFRSANHTYSTGQDTYLFNMGYRRDAASEITITFNETGTFTVESLKVCCQPMESYESYIKALSENALEDVKISSNTITGKVSADKEKFLVLSIPYQKGWTAYVDGKKTDIKKANLMYSGLFLDAGEHQIRLEFERPGIKASLCISAAGIVIFIIALIIRRRRITMVRQSTIHE